MKTLKLIIASALVMLSLSLQAENSLAKKTRSIKTDFPTKDWVISDFIVTDYGAKAEAGFDNREAFQKAIDAAYNAGGGVVYAPSGIYEFSSTQTGTMKVRVREGSSETIKEFSYNYVLKLPAGVQLRGDWADPQSNGGKVEGTVLSVLAGKDAPAYDAYVSSWWNDGQAGNALRTTYTSIADRFIEMNAGTGVTNLSIWYPEQDIDDVKPYPWTLYQVGVDCATVEHVTLVNAYNGFYATPAELHYVLNSYMTCLNKGMEIHVCTDIGRIENVRVNPSYWASSGLPGAPSYEKIEAYTRENAVGYEMHRSDWEYVSYLYVEGCKTGVWIGREQGYADTPNAQLFEIHVDKCGNGLYVQDVNPYGILISNSSFASDDKGNAVYFLDDFNTSVQFNGVSFGGPVVSDGKGGAISFESCDFKNIDGYSLKFNSGNAILTQCSFESDKNHVYLGENMKLLKSINSGYDRKLSVENAGEAVVEEICGDEYAFEPIPSDIKTDIAVHPRPARGVVIKADLPRATGYNNDAPTVDVSDMLQKELNRLRFFGGTVYLPAGRYLVNKPIVVPAGVELRGSWDVQHHTMSGGTAIFTNYDGGEKGTEGTPLIRLKKRAGLRGLNVVQANIVSDGFDTMEPRQTPFLIQGMGKRVYLVNVTIPLGDKGVDLATYNTSGHYVDYMGGVLLRAGIWVGGGAEGGYIRNMQFNPHYGARMPEGGQGYPNAVMTRYIQSHSSALKFADVKNQTIFNNFVYGSIYGIHFLKDEVTGNYPGQMTMVGHGSDGCTFSLFVEDADKDTKIVGINSELVNTRILEQPLRSYVLMGKEANTEKVDPNATLVLYNSALWGSPITAATVNNGIVRFQQANFQRSGTPGINVNGGKIHIYSSYFSQPMPGEDELALMKERYEKMQEEMKAHKDDPRHGKPGEKPRKGDRRWRPGMFLEKVPEIEDCVYARLRESGEAIELTNNLYVSGLLMKDDKDGGIYGADVK